MDNEVRKRNVGDSVISKEQRIIRQQDEGIEVLKETLENMYATSNDIGREIDEQEGLLADLEKEVDDTGFAAKRGVDHIRAVKLGSNGRRICYYACLSASAMFIFFYLIHSGYFELQKKT